MDVDLPDAATQAAPGSVQPPRTAASAETSAETSTPLPSPGSAQPAAPVPRSVPDPAPVLVPVPAPAPVLGENVQTDRRAGLVLAWASCGPALLLVGFLVVAYPLALGGVAHPLPVLLLAVPVAAALVGLARRLPAIPDTPRWATVTTLGLTVLFAALAGATHSEHVVVRRDPAVYALTAHWIAGHGSLRIPAELAVAGGNGPLITAGSPGFYPVNDHLTPQFMSGTALALSPGGWVSDWGGIFLLAGVYAALAVLAVAGLAARLIGPRWAPLAALALGLSQPMLLTARTTFSEPVAQLLLFGGLCLLVDSLTGSGSRLVAALAGLSLGLGLLVRIDALRDAVPLIPIVGWLAVRRRPQWLPLTAGLLVGGGYGTVDLRGPSKVYAHDLAKDIHLVLLGGGALTVLAAVVVVATRLAGARVPPGRLAVAPRWLAYAAAGGVALVLGFLAARPAFGPVHDPNGYKNVVRGLQLQQGLPVDAARSYAEQSVRWLSWYLGWPLVVLAGSAAVLVTWWALRTGQERWIAALALPLASAMLVLWRPGITPDHPWADRRLVPTVLPVVVLLAVAAVAVATRAVQRRESATATAAATATATPAGGRTRPGTRGRLVALVAAVGSVALVVPVGYGSARMLFARTEVGETRAVDEACAAFTPNSVALTVDARTRQEWVPALRQVCGIPTFSIPSYATDRDATRYEVGKVAAQVRAGGRRPVLVATSGSPLPKLTSRPEHQVLLVTTSEHVRLLNRRPDGLTGLHLELWVAEAP